MAQAGQPKNREHPESLICRRNPWWPGTWSTGDPPLTALPLTPRVGTEANKRKGLTAVGGGVLWGHSPCYHTGPHAQKGMHFQRPPAVKFFIILEQGDQHFYFVQGPANYVAGPGYGLWNIRGPGFES